MSEIIDQGQFDCVAEQKKQKAQTENQHILDYKTLFQDVFINLKYKQCERDPIWKYKKTCVLSQFQSDLDLCAQLTFSETEFVIKVRNLCDNRLSAVNHKQTRKNLVKQLSKRSSIRNLSPMKFVLCFDNGDCYVKSPVHLIQENSRQSKKRFHRLIQQLVEKSIRAFTIVARIVREKQQDISQIKQYKINQIMRYYVRCTIQPSISIKSDCAEYEYTINKYAISKCGLEDLLQSSKASLTTSSLYFQNLRLYGLNLDSSFNISHLDEITLKQKQKIQEQMFIPSFSMSKPKENKFVFNYCYFLRGQYPEKKIAEGINSDISVLKPQIYEQSSTNSEDQTNLTKSQNISKYITKHLIVKVNKDLSSLIMGRSRKLVSRQSQIVSHMRGGTCLFLPKYYLNIQKQSLYSQKLFADYLHGETLDEYLALNAGTVSIFTKMYILLQVMQGLRFISQFGIVHLDVKQQNIMVMRKLICKIFDFGESYHYKVCGKNHKPKYTLLYAPPEVVTSTKGRVFTQKSDIFSLGVMMHKIMFGRYPYIFPDQKSFQKCNFENKLREKTFYVPERNQDYGDKRVIHIINQLILKCLEMDETGRPYLDWTTLIIKSCLNYITSQ